MNQMNNYANNFEQNYEFGKFSFPDNQIYFAPTTTNNLTPGAYQDQGGIKW